MALEILLCPCPVAVIAHLLPCEAVPGAAAVLASASCAAAHLGHTVVETSVSFPVKTYLWWVYPYLVLFQACPLAPIPAACKHWFSHPCVSPGSNELDPTAVPRSAPARWEGAQLRLRAARRFCVRVRPI